MRRPVRAALLAVTLLALAAPTLGRGGGSRRRQDPLSAGHPALVPVLEALENGERTDLGETAGKPLVLIFGSYT